MEQLDDENKDGETRSKKAMWPDEAPIIRMPNGLPGELLDRMGITDVSADWLRFVHLKPMEGIEEDMITNRQYARDGSTIQKILESVILGFGPEPDDIFNLPKEKKEKLIGQIHLADTGYLVARLRAWSLDIEGDEEMEEGSIFRFEATCPVLSCKRKERYLVDMREQPLTFRENNPGLFWEMKTSQGVLKLKYLTCEDNKKLARVQKESPDRLLTMKLFLQCVSMNEQKITSYDVVRRWGTGLRNKVRRKIQENDFGMDMTVHNVCPACSTEFDIDMPLVNESFFFPSGIQRG